MSPRKCHLDFIARNPKVKNTVALAHFAPSLGRTPPCSSDSPPWNSRYKKRAGLRDAGMKKHADFRDADMKKHAHYIVVKSSQ